MFPLYLMQVLWRCASCLGSVLQAQAAAWACPPHWASCAAQAVRTGSVRQLSEGLQANQAAFIRAGTFLLMEKLRQAVYRRLLKRVWLLHRESDPDKAHQLPLGACAAARP